MQNNYNATQNNVFSGFDVQKKISPQHTIADWFKINLILSIPALNIIAIILWGTSEEDLELKNFVLGKVLCIIVVGIIAAITGFVFH